MLISLSEYAKRLGVASANVRQKILRGKLRARKIGNSWAIEEDEPYIDHRKKK